MRFDDAAESASGQMLVVFVLPVSEQARGSDDQDRQLWQALGFGVLH